MMKKAMLVPNIKIVIPLILLLSDASTVESRAQIVKLLGGTQPQKKLKNLTVFGPNFIATMENISTQTRTSGYGVEQRAQGPTPLTG